MTKIKFSHRYYKMPGSFNNTFLYQIFVEEKENLSKEFLIYDTRYGEKSFYKLKDGKHIVLVFYTDNHLYSGLWTTIRIHNEKKEKYYRDILGEEVEIEIKE